MYKEPFIIPKTSDSTVLRIERKIKEVAAKVDTEQSDADFAANLLDLCTLNRMAESHESK